MSKNENHINDDFNQYNYNDYGKRSRINKTMQIIKILLSDLSATTHLAVQIAPILPCKFVIGLSGDLGAGKTTLVREILYAMGVTDKVKSPTFTLVEPYQIKDFRIYHFDLYRFNDIDDWFSLGFDEYFIDSTICFIEWFEKADGLIPDLDWVMNLSQTTTGEHHVEIVAKTPAGAKILKKLVDLRQSIRPNLPII